jgi:hypothetical protein
VLNPAGFCNDVAKSVERGKTKNKNSQPMPGIINKYGVLLILLLRGFLISVS